MHDSRRRRGVLGDPLERGFTMLKRCFCDSRGRARLGRSWQAHCTRGVRMWHMVGTISQARNLIPEQFQRPCALIGARVHQALPTLSVIWRTNERAPRYLYWESALQKMPHLLRPHRQHKGRSRLHGFLSSEFFSIFRNRPIRRDLQTHTRLHVTAMSLSSPFVAHRTRVRAHR